MGNKENVSISLHHQNKVIVNELSVPITSNVKELNQICKKLLPESDIPSYLFYLRESLITDTLLKSTQKLDLNIEEVLSIVIKEDKSVKQSNISTCTHTLPGHKQPILALKFSTHFPNMFVSAGGDGTVIFWDTYTNSPFQTFESVHKGWVFALDFLPLSENPKYKELMVSIDSNGYIIVFGITEFKKVEMIKNHKVHTESLTAIKLVHYNNKITAIVGTLDGKIYSLEIALSSTNNHKVNILNMVSLSKNSIKKIKMIESIKDVIFVSGDFNQIEALNIKYLKIVTTLRGHANFINDFSLLYDEESNLHTILTASKDNTCMRYSLNANENEIKLLNKPERITGHIKGVYSVLYTSRFKYIISCSEDKTIKVYTWKDLKNVYSLRGHVNDIYGMVLSTDEKYLFSFSKDNTVKMWDLAEGKLKNDLYGHDGQVFIMDLRKKGDIIISGGEDCKIKVWKK
eukprot:GAHX01001737.1.p1 GENE.GAHX01001737.1~~GAHX01001737.1.p1  ORF type:complete len:459 (+),score=87.64 GAHX01001737.1:56-1432(+)